MRKQIAWMCALMLTASGLFQGTVYAAQTEQTTEAEGTTGTKQSAGRAIGGSVIGGSTGQPQGGTDAQASARQVNTDLISFVGGNALSLESLIQKGEIVSLAYRRNHETSVEYSASDAETLQAFYDAFAKITVTQTTQERSSDQDDIFYFTMQNADACRFAFNGHHLEIDGVCYELSGDETLWELADQLAETTTGTVQTAGDWQTGPFLLTSIKDIDTGMTVARCYAPQNFQVFPQTLWWGTGAWQSPASPAQVVIQVGEDVSSDVSMLYMSDVVYIYHELSAINGTYQEGALYYNTYPQLEPMDAQQYADYLVRRIDPDSQIVFEEELTEGTDEQIQWLTSQAQTVYDSYQQSMQGVQGVSLNTVACTAADRIYSFTDGGVEYKVELIVSTIVSDFSQVLSGQAYHYYTWNAPYAYAYIAPKDQFDAGKPAFNLFAANTSVSDEFSISVAKISTELISQITLGNSVSYSSVETELQQDLQSSADSYQTERFTDYILSQETYTTSEGKEIKIPNNYDYVYEGDDGNIYVSDSAFDEPAGATRLQKK